MAVVPKVVVIGAGFGGLEVARHLKGAPVEVTLVDQHNFHTFQPLLYQVATAGLNAADVAHAGAGPLPRPVERAVPAGPGDGRRLGRPRGVRRRPARPALRPPRPGRRRHASPTSAPRARPSTASRSTRSRTRPACGTTSCAASRRPTPIPAELDRGRPHLRRRRRRADRRRDGRRAGRAVRDGVPQGLPGPRREPGPRRARRDAGPPAPPVHGAEPPPRPRHPPLAAASRCGSAPRSRRWRPTASPSPTARCSRARRSCGRPACRPTRWPRRSASPQDRGGRVVVGPDLRVAGRTRASGRSATSPPPAIAAASCCPSWRPSRCRAAATSPARSAACSRAVPPSRSATATRAPWPRSAAGPRWPSCPGGIRLRGAPAWLAWLGLHLVFLVGKRNRLSVLLNWAWNYLTWDRGPRLILDRPTPDAFCGRSRSHAA